jgi:FkbM family methyltransferase
MMVALKRSIRRAIRKLAVGSELEYACRSYSQEGEDRVLDRFFGFREPGFYVDVGAHHPHRFSNTHLFYKRGWRGINIDAMPGSMVPFRRLRRRDINLEMGVGEISGTAKFFVFNEPALNTFDETTAKAHTRPEWQVTRTIDVAIEPLSVILKQYLPAGTNIDFFSVDVEGRDLNVLKSNDWSLFRPEVILVESLGKDLSELQTDETVLFLKAVGYTPYAKTVNTFFFTRERILDQ